MLRDVSVAGVGLTAFGKHLDRSLGELATEAAEAALGDAGIDAGEVGATFFSNAAGGLIGGQEMIRGQVALKGLGLPGGPLGNVESACASGSLAAHLAWLYVGSGLVDVAIAVGAEKLFDPDKELSFRAIESGTDLSLDLTGKAAGSVMMGAYADQANAYAARHGDIVEALSEIAVKNRTAAGLNENAQFRAPISRADVLESRMVADPLRLLTCSPLTDGGAALVFRAAEAGPGPHAPVGVRASVPRSYLAGESVVERAAAAALAEAGLAASDLDVLQLHDACAYAELIQYEQIGLVEAGGAAEFLLAGEAGLGGAFPTNTDGGLLSRGHALGATGLAQIGELVLQLRGEAGDRQVDAAARAMVVNSGGWMGDDYAAAIVTVLDKDRSAG